MALIFGSALLTAILLAYQPAYAKVEVIEFEDPAKEALYKEMIQELRCLVCHNQNLADSNAELAVDLRRRTRELIAQGQTKKDITGYMVQRYGEFVMYRPPLNAATFVLWFAPAILLAVVIWIALRARNKNKVEIAGYSEDERARIRSLMDQDIKSPTENGGALRSANLKGG